MLRALIKESYQRRNPSSQLGFQLAGDFKIYAGINACIGSGFLLPEHIARFNLPQINMDCVLEYKPGERVKFSFSVPIGHDEEVEEVRRMLRERGLRKVS